jgi:hypothetical protein
MIVAAARGLSSFARESGARESTLEVSLVSLSVRSFGLACSVLSLCALPARAQEKSKDERPTPVGVPASALPPAGQCRVWLRDVPAGQQPASTDCVTAIRKAPPTAIVLFGDPKSETASPAQSRSAAPGANGRMSDGSGRASVPAARGYAPGAQRGGPMRTDRSGASRNPAAGPPPSAARRPAPASPTKPPEKPQS